jgi:hypothetical protein
VTVNDLLVGDACDTTRGVALAKTLLQEGKPYSTTSRIDGSIEYTFDDGFIQRMLDTIETGIVASFSKKEKDLVDRYLDFQLNDGNNDADVIELDNKLGEM